MRRLLPLFLVVLAALAFCPPSASAALGRHCTIVAGPRHVVVRGTPGGDVICATRGRHVIYALGGDDIVYAGAGDDVVYAGGGDDIVRAGRGADRLYGGPGNDILVGGRGVDLLLGGTGGDLVRGGRAGDGLRGGPGADTLDGGGGDDSLWGGAGDDTLNGGVGDDHLDGGDGRNTCDGDAGADTLSFWCDSQPPQLVSMSLTSATVDTSQADAQVTVTVHVADDLSGFSSGSVSFESGQPRGGAMLNPSTRIAGSAKDGIYQSIIYIPRNTPQGEMPLRVDLYDNLGNHLALTSAQLAARGMPSAIDQAGAGDVQGPHLVAASLSDTMIDTSTTPQTVTLRVHVTDDVAGLAFGDVLWRSPSGSQTKDGYIEPAERVSGTATDGEYAVAVTFPAGSAQGAWTLEGFSLTDRADNQTTGTGLELEAMADLDMTIHQTGASDTTPPAVQSATFAPTPVDDRDGPTLVWMDAHVTDDLSGATEVTCDFRSPSGRQTFNLAWTLGLGQAPVLDGTVRVGQWVAANWAQPGTWSGSCAAIDMVGNRSTGLPVSISFL